jgi:hypothetical protein
VLLVAVSAARGQVALNARRDLPVGRNPRAIVAGDLDGDGTTDLVVANGSTSDLSILLGAGQGIFRPGTRISTGFSPRGLVLASLSSVSDSIADLGVADLLQDRFEVFLGNGVGGFGASRTFGTGGGTRPVAIAAVDWNQDGVRDLVVVLQGTSACQVWTGDGLGGFALHQTFAVGASPSALAAGDWNGDGKADLAIASEGNDTVVVLAGCSSGFCSPVTLPVQPAPTSIAIGLLDADSLPDLAVSSEGSDSLSLLLANAGSAPGPAVALLTGAPSFAVSIADLDADSKADLVVGIEAAGGQGAVKFLKGDGLGSFIAGGSFRVGSTPVGVVAAALGGTAALDLATANVTAESVSLLFGDGTGGFTTTPAYLAGTAPNALASADLSGDARLDLAVVDGDADLVTLLLGSGSGSFSAWQSLDLPGNPSHPAGAVAILADRLTTDGNLDLAVVNNNRDSISVFAGNGAGTFSGPSTYPVGGIDVSPGSLAAAPLNDGDAAHPDLVVTNESGDTAFPDGSVSVFLRGPSGLLPATRFEAGIAPAGVAAGRVDADATWDVVVTNFSANTLSLLPGAGTGVLGAPTPTTTGSGPRSPLLRDLDGDADLDLLGLNSGAGSVSVFLGDGAGGFAAAGQVGCGPDPRAAVLVDLNQDGWDDLATVNTTAASVSILLGDGAGHFGVPIRFGVGASPWGIAAGDFDLDGRADLATADLADGQVSILRNTSQLPLLTLSQGPGGTVVSWPPFAEAAAYEVIRGQVEQFVDAAGQINLGAVTCVENDSSDTSTTGHEDAATPAARKAFFYLFRTVDPLVKGSYGRGSSGKIRIPATGNCS